MLSRDEEEEEEYEAMREGPGAFIKGIACLVCDSNVRMTSGSTLSMMFFLSVVAAGVVDADAAAPSLRVGVGEDTGDVGDTAKAAEDEEDEDEEGGGVSRLVSSLMGEEDVGDEEGEDEAAEEEASSSGEAAEGDGDEEGDEDGEDEGEASSLIGLASSSDGGEDMTRRAFVCSCGARRS